MMIKVMRRMKDYALCVLGALLVAVGIYFFKMPNQFSTGGVSGLAVILNGYAGLSSVGVITLALNSVLLVLGFAFVSKDSGLKTVIGTFTMSGAILLLEKVFPLRAPLTDEPLLELIFAVLFPAIGAAILFNCNGSTGGTDIIAMILKKYTNINIGAALLFSDLLITLGAFVFGPKTGLLSLLGLTAKVLIVDSVIENINLSKCFSIITQNPDEISGYISGTLRRSCTIIEATGGFTHSNTHVVVAAMNRFQAIQLRNFLRERYPQSFIIITNSSEIIGKGFRGL